MGIRIGEITAEKKCLEDAQIEYLKSIEELKKYVDNHLQELQVLNFRCMHNYKSVDIILIQGSDQRSKSAKYIKYI